MLENGDVGVLLHERDHVRLQDLVDVAASSEVASKTNPQIMQTPTEYCAMCIWSTFAQRPTHVQ